MRAALLVVALSVACTQDVGLIDNPRCDGVLQRGEDVVDGPFDRDGDGFVDGGKMLIKQFKILLSLKLMT